MFVIDDPALLQLPPKRIFNNDEPSFIHKRRSELQDYLRSVIVNFSPPCPPPLRVFLTHELYDLVDCNFVDYDIVDANTDQTVSRVISANDREKTTTTAAITGRTMPAAIVGSLIDIGIESSASSSTAGLSASSASPWSTSVIKNAGASTENALDSDSALDAFSMTPFVGNVTLNSAVANAASTHSLSSARVPSLPPPISSFSAASSSAAWFPGSEIRQTEQNEGRKGGEHAVRESAGHSRWFHQDADSAPTTNRINANHGQNSMIPSHSEAFVPSFVELHRRFREQILMTHQKRKTSSKSNGAASTVFVDDLISF